jgi:hypothetical protein
MLLVLVVSICNQPPKPGPHYALLSDPQTESGGRSQCLANNCYSAPPNLECRLVGDSCETIVMGGAQQDYSPEMKAKGEHAEFFMQRVIKNNQAMQSAGIETGDMVTRVNGIYAGSDLEFSKLILSLPKGTKLSLWTNKGERKEVTL